LVDDLGLRDSVVLWHTLPRPQVFEKMAECDVLMHPSLHDSGGWVTVEAMGAGLPVICLDLGGPALQVTDVTGIKIPANSPEQVVTDLAGALERISRDSAHRLHLGEASRARIEKHYSWDRRGEQLAALYEQMVSEKAVANSLC
jgi:glycosyltransferase involved in cell wall biosynthesis